MLKDRKRVLFIVYHPVEPHIYNRICKKLNSQKFDAKFVIFEKEDLIEKITKSFGISYYKIGKTINNKFLRTLNIPIILLRLISIFLHYKPNVIFSATSPYAGISAFLLKIPIIGWSDTETASFNNNLSRHYFNTIILPQTFMAKIKSNKVIYYNGYKELVYLHPKWFKPDNEVLEKLQIEKGEKIVLMRFSALKAMHDIGLKSAGEEKEVILHYIKKMEKYARIFISMTEKDLGEEFNKYKLNIHPSEYIHLLAHCTLYIGEGTTTASEAGVLGVPWINIQETTRGYLIDQEKNYNLGFRTNDIDYAFNKAIEWLKDDELLEKWQIKRKKLISDKIDVSVFLVWFIENYPESHKIMKENPDYQNKFK